MSRKMVKNEYRLVFARDDKTKIVMIKQSCYYFINSKVYGLIIYGIIFKYSLYFYAFVCSTLITFGFNIM
jgi:hypothetical protein